MPRPFSSPSFSPPTHRQKSQICADGSSTLQDSDSPSAHRDSRICPRLVVSSTPPRRMPLGSFSGRAPGPGRRVAASAAAAAAADAAMCRRGGTEGEMSRKQFIAPDCRDNNCLCCGAGRRLVSGFVHVCPSATLLPSHSDSHFVFKLIGPMLLGRGLQLRLIVVCACSWVVGCHCSCSWRWYALGLAHLHFLHENVDNDPAGNPVDKRSSKGEPETCRVRDS